MASGDPIRVFLVDDSPLALVLLKRMLSSSPEIEVVGTARGGREALAALEIARPDVICTDYQMPEMDGLELIQHIMARFPRPILVISSLIDPAKREQVFPLLSAGAVDVWAKPGANPAPEQAAALVQKIKLLSGVVVIARRLPPGLYAAEIAVAIQPPPPPRIPATSPFPARKTPRELPAEPAPRPESAPQSPSNDPSAPQMLERESGEASRDTSSQCDVNEPLASPAPQTFEAARLSLQNVLESERAPRLALRAAIALASAAPAENEVPPLRAYQVHPIRLVAIGASTGGPQILHAIFAQLPPLECPVLCVQHISAGFLQGLVDWLDSASRARVKIAGSGEAAAPGTIYFPPEGAHLEIDARGRLIHSPAPPVGGHRPAINVTFESVARAYGANSVGVLLTGMGCDGAAGLEALMLAGSATIAQDEASSVVFGMPKQAIARGAAHWVLPDDQIAAKIVRLVAAV